MGAKKYTDAMVRRLAKLRDTCESMAVARKQFNKEFKKAQLKSDQSAWQLLYGRGYRQNGNGKRELSEDQLHAEITRMREEELMSFRAIREDLERRFPNADLPHVSTISARYRKMTSEREQQPKKASPRVSVDIIARFPNGDVVLGRVSPKQVIKKIEEQLCSGTRDCVELLNNL